MSWPLPSTFFLISSLFTLPLNTTHSEILAMSLNQS
jgi:hypothetical protein